MNGRKNRQSDSGRKGPLSIRVRMRWYRLPTADRRRQLRITRDFHRDDGRAGSHAFDFAIPWDAAWISYQCAIVTASLGTAAVGVGQLVTQLLGR